MNKLTFVSNCRCDWYKSI